MAYTECKTNRPTHSPLPLQSLHARYQGTRSFTDELCEPLEREDMVIQSMEDVSPTKWHLAHTTWFFETFVLKAFNRAYREFHPSYNYLFNSYYNTVGDRHARPQRGMLARPTVDDIRAYRAYVDDAMNSWLSGTETKLSTDQASVLELGLHHEQQHQELMVTDLKHVFAQNPLFPVYRRQDSPAEAPISFEWVDIPEGQHEIGYAGDAFCFDNERPVHTVYINPVQLGNRPVTNEDYIAFIEDGGYRRHELWLSSGWDTICAEGWQHPIYWQQLESRWHEFTLAGMKPVQPTAPVCHLSYFEADAFARWSGYRLPTEAEWEVACGSLPMEGNLAETRRFHPTPAATPTGSLLQMVGDVWEWTQSSYSPYPGFATADGALGEYNGKWMCNQYVLRGGSCATPQSHIRKSYRNFFPAHARWQFSGVRLAKDKL